MLQGTDFGLEFVCSAGQGHSFEDDRESENGVDTRNMYANFGRAAWFVLSEDT